MSPRSQPPRTVAELGRPETPEETAARKAQDSANHRNRQTLTNLIYALIATLVIVAIIVILAPYSKGRDTAPPVNYTSIAENGKGSEADPLLAPALPSGWRSNSATLHTDTPDGVDFWYIGFITPLGQFVAVSQGFNANDTWVDNQVNHTTITGTRTIDGVRWDVYDNRKSGENNGNVDYALATTAGHSSIVVYGTAQDSEFVTMAKSLAGPLHALKGH